MSDNNNPYPKKSYPKKPYDASKFKGKGKGKTQAKKADWKDPNWTPTDLYQECTDRILEALDKGTAPWQRPWDFKDIGNHTNAATGDYYHGLNPIFLAMEGAARGFSDTRWATYDQAIDKKWGIKKGEKGTPIYFFKPMEVDVKDETTGLPKLDDEGKPVRKRISVLKRFTVFNTAQMENPPPPAPLKQRGHEWNTVLEAEKLINGYDVPVSFGGDRAYYQPSAGEVGRIQMPDRDQFKTPEDFYAVFLHEISHSTGHKSKLDRFGPTPARFGTDLYAKEELTAELSSLYICSALSLTSSANVDRHAAYIESWKKLLKSDKKAIFTASREATQASNWVLGIDRVPLAERDEKYRQQKDPTLGWMAWRYPSMTDLDRTFKKEGITLEEREPGKFYWHNQDSTKSAGPFTERYAAAEHCYKEEGLKPWRSAVRLRGPDGFRETFVSADQFKMWLNSNPLVPAEVITKAQGLIESVKPYKEKLDLNDYREAHQNLSAELGLYVMRNYDASLFDDSMKSIIERLDRTDDPIDQVQLQASIGSHFLRSVDAGSFDESTKGLADRIARIGQTVARMEKAEQKRAAKEAPAESDQEPATWRLIKTETAFALVSPDGEISNVNSYQALMESLDTLEKMEADEGKTANIRGHLEAQYWKQVPVDEYKELADKVMQDCFACDLLNLGVDNERVQVAHEAGDSPLVFARQIGDKYGLQESTPPQHPYGLYDRSKQPGADPVAVPGHTQQPEPSKKAGTDYGMPGM